MSKEFKHSIQEALPIRILRERWAGSRRLIASAAPKPTKASTSKKCARTSRKSNRYAASHFDELAEDFTRDAEARGAKVFRTSDPQAVKDYILRLAQGKRRQEHRQIEVDGVGGNPPQSNISKKPESRSGRPTWASGSFNWPGSVLRTW